MPPAVKHSVCILEQSCDGIEGGGGEAECKIAWREAETFHPVTKMGIRIEVIETSASIPSDPVPPF